ncbi:prolyl aminopeptidase [Aquicoccus sp. G2-2]|uniref:prolyl aminopeptidase n=1 Tax=Aquicoccus sp. G2-2 TaxID=3092120 RepID=UPI002AE07D9F|nr:prolyl aminopeptidase [Aquicoccus sp. G2-2]MEA1114578.1 prolyl aminopeptidase [Aquicoccus sp. G2-2]
MDKHADPKRAADFLYSQIEPFDQRMLDRGDGHRIYMEQSGNPEGAPVIVFHGGPGGGCSPAMRRYFDPAHYRIILFDQRGCGRSQPHASVENNTTWHLVRDIEAIREILNIDKWAVFGGSWGATLALIYAQAHPDRVSHLILRGVFLATRAELDWFYGGGAGAFWPETWERFQALVPEGERDDMIAAYHKRLFSGDGAEELLFSRAWARWENSLASVRSNGDGGAAGGEYSRAFARLENHYFSNGAFLDYDGQLIEEMHKISHIPGVIVQGRFDMICPPVSAWRIAQKWEKVDLKLIPVAGHALSEPGISAALVEVMDRLAGN